MSLEHLHYQDYAFLIAECLTYVDLLNLLRREDEEHNRMEEDGDDSWKRVVKPSEPCVLATFHHFYRGHRTKDNILRLVRRRY